ncbi:MAG TPA: helix-turn-helix transcriptional regulator [Stellaceae bacterium]|nr:helix-turn-helix transcriptional regulator [Stellaceae bacterium]
MRGRGRPAVLTSERRYPNRLRALRESNGFSQQTVAAIAGISGAYYGALERGDKRINADTAQRLSSVLGCPAGDLLGGAQSVSAPIVYAVAAAESDGRPPEYDLPEPYERVSPRRLAQAERCVAAEIFDDSADVDFSSGTILFMRPIADGMGSVAVGARVLVRFFLDPGDASDRRTHEVLYGILDRNVVGDLVLITRSRNRLIPRHLLVQNGATSEPGFTERIIASVPREQQISYAPRADDAATLLGVVVYAMGPVGS